MLPSGVQVNKPLVGFLLVLTCALIWYVKFRGVTTTETPAKTEQSAKDSLPISEPNEAAIPQKNMENKQETKVVQVKGELKKMKVDDKDVEIFTREAVPTGEVKGHILLLHGQSFSSANWEEIKTLQEFSALGYRVLAIDLPGYGQSKLVNKPSDPVMFMKTVVSSLQLEKPVLVSPSMSGNYSLPFVTAETDLLSGFVALAPVIPKAITDAALEKVQIPVLILYGSKDIAIGIPNAVRLKKIPNHTEQILEGGHAVYITKPVEFHKHLLTFIQSLNVNS